jgi:hypothetical protein
MDDQRPTFAVQRQRSAAPKLVGVVWVSVGVYSGGMRRHRHEAR